MKLHIYFFIHKEALKNPNVKIEYIELLYSSKIILCKIINIKIIKWNEKICEILDKIIREDKNLQMINYS